jgi:hypothetical protein
MRFAIERAKLTLALLAEIVPGGTSTDIELAAAVTSAVPVIAGVIMGSSPQEIKQISNQHLRLNLWLAFAFRMVAVIAFTVGIVTGIFGLQGASNTILTFLGSIVMVSIAQIIDRSARRSQNFALSVEQMKREEHDRDQGRALLMQNLEAIEDPQARDRARLEVTKALARSITAPMPAPILDKSQDGIPALEPAHKAGGNHSSGAD